MMKDEKLVHVYLILVLFFSGGLCLLRRPVPEKLNECSQSLGLYNGAIKDGDLSASVYYVNNDLPMCGGIHSGRLSSLYWCTYRSSYPLYYAVDFNFPTVVTGFRIVVTEYGVKGMYLAYTSGDNNRDEFQFVVEKEFPEKSPTFFLLTSAVTYWFKAFKARVVRIYATTDLDQQLDNDNYHLWSALKFEFFGCPYWDYARPLGMSSRMISDSKITSFNFENEVSNPLNARLGLKERYWRQFGTVPVQTTLDSNRFWLQIVLPDLKKLVYIVVQSNRFDEESHHYWLKYGLDQVSLSAYEKNGAAYKIEPPNTPGYQNTSHIFEYPLIAKVIRYIPCVNTASNSPNARLELYGVNVLTPDNNWKLAPPYEFLDHTQFQDLRSSKKIEAGDYYASVRSGVGDLLRTEEMGSPDCLINPSNCHDGLSLAFYTNGDVKMSGHGDSIPVFAITQKRGNICNIIELADIYYNMPLGLYISKFDVQRYDKIHPKIIVENSNNLLNMQFQAYVYINQEPTFVSECKYVDTALHPIHVATVSFHDQTFDVGNLLNNIVQSVVWTMGSSLSIILEQLTNFNTFIKRRSTVLLSPQVFSECAYHESNIISQLPNDKMSLGNPASCSHNAYQIKMSDPIGFSTCSGVNTYVGINLLKTYKIIAFKIASLANINVINRNMMTKFQIEYAYDSRGPWKFVNNGDEKYVFERKQIVHQKVEVMPLPFPVYARFIRIHPVPNAYTGDANGFRFDIITCGTPPAKSPTWIKLNSKPVCFGARNGTFGTFNVTTDADVSFFKLSYLSGGVKCTPDGTLSNWGCDPSLIGVVLTDEEKNIIAPPEAIGKKFYELLTFNSKSPEIHLSLFGPQFLRQGEKLSLYHASDFWNSEVEDNSETTCTDIYGWGKTVPHHGLIVSHHLCVMVDINNHFKLSSSCEDLFFVTLKRHLVHANTGKCVAVNCTTEPCKLQLSDVCNNHTKFEVNVNNGAVKHTQTGYNLVSDGVEMSNIALSAVLNHLKILRFTDALYLKHTTYYDNDFVVSKAVVSRKVAEHGCKNLNLDMISLRNLLEMEIIFKFLQKHSITDNVFHVGVSKRDNKGLTWLDGSPFNKVEFDTVPKVFTELGCVVWISGRLEISTTCNPARYICRKRTNLDSDMSPKIPIISSGLHSVEGYLIGKGFHVSASKINSEIIMSAGLKSTDVSCEASFKITSGWKLYGMTWVRKEKQLKIFVNGEHIATGSCIAFSQLSNTALPIVIHSMFNFVNLVGFYDHLYGYLQMKLSDVQLWRHVLKDSDFVELFSKDEITFSEHYSENKKNAGYQIINSACFHGTNTTAPCQDVDMLLQPVEDIVCDWISGAPIATTFSQYDTVPGENHCVYKCSTESEKNHSINGVLYMNNTCYCVFDMYDVDEKIQRQKSCFLPTKVRFGAQTTASGLLYIRIHPINKMWYAFNNWRNRIYRHPARPSRHAKIWEHAISLNTQIHSFKFIDKDVWIVKDQNLFLWKDEILVKKADGIKDFTVCDNFTFIIDNAEDIFVQNGDVLTAIRYGNFKFIECDVYNKRVIAYSEDRQMIYFSTTNHAILLDLPRVPSTIIQLVVSKYGIIYVMTDNFQVFMHVEGLASDGRVHQYPILQVSVPGLSHYSIQDHAASEKTCAKFLSELPKFNNEYEFELLMASAMHWVTATYVGLKKVGNIFNWFDGKAPTYLPWCENDPKTENCAGVYPPRFCVSTYTCSNNAPLICKEEESYLNSGGIQPTAKFIIRKSQLSQGESCEIFSQFNKLIHFTPNSYRHFMLTFNVNIEKEVVISRAFVDFVFNDPIVPPSPIKYSIIPLKEVPTSCGNLTKYFEFIKPVIWEFTELNREMESPDISTLIQHAVNGDWFYGKELKLIFFLEEAYNLFNFESSLHNSALRIYYKNQKPNNFLYFQAELMEYYDTFSNVYRTSYNTLSFWSHMYGENAGTLFVWIINAAHETPQIIYQSNVNQNQWQEIHVILPNVPSSVYKIEFHVLYNKHTSGHVAIDRIKLYNSSVVEPSNFVSSYNSSDMASYRSIIKKLGYPLPKYLFPFATKEHYLKDYGPFRMANQEAEQQQSLTYLFGTDKYGFSSHGIGKPSKTNVPLLRTLIFDMNLTVLFHLKPVALNKTQYIFNLGRDFSKYFSICLLGHKMGLRLRFDRDAPPNIYYYQEPTKKNDWTYYAITFSEDRIMFYYNNTLDSEFNIQEKNISTLPPQASFGSWPKSEVFASRFYSGYMSCFCLYDKVLKPFQIEALEFCPNRQDLSYHNHTCKNGLSVAFGDRKCACFDSNLRHQTSSCENAFTQTVYQTASVYIPFDYENAIKCEKGKFRLTYQSSNNVHLKPGPVDYAACVNDHFSKIGSMSIRCTKNIFNCIRFIGFWFYFPQRLYWSAPIKVFQFANIVIYVNTLSNKTTIDVQWNGETCANTDLPLNSWIYISIRLEEDKLGFYLNTKKIDITGKCKYPFGNNIGLLELSIGSYVCIDEFSIFKLLNTPAKNFYKHLIFDAEYINSAVITLDITSSDFMSFTKADEKFTKQSIMLMVKEFFKQFRDEKTRYISSKPLEITFNDTVMHVPVLVKLSYLSYAIENEFYNQPTQEHTFESRKYFLNWNKTSSNIAIPLETSFTPVVINSTSIVLKIPTLDEEDKRYHYMFTVVLYENTSVASQVAETVKHKYNFETGVLTLLINNLTAFRSYEIILWTRTHQGYSKRAVESILTPADVNFIPPQDVEAFNTSHTSIKVKWSLYDNVKHWNSENMTIRIYWKKVDFAFNTTQNNLSSYNYTDMHSTLKDFIDFNYGDDVITSYEITGLEAFTNYSILVATVNDVGVGAFASIYCRSGQWLPESLYNISAAHTAKDVITMQWKYPDNIEVFNSWILDGFNITLYPTLNTLENITMSLSSSERSKNLSLGYFKRYRAVIFPYNIVGMGPPVDICFATPKGVPSSAPETLELVNATHLLLNIKFGNVSTQNENGVILYYHIRYKSLDWLDNTHNRWTTNLTHTKEDIQMWKNMSNFIVPCSTLSRVDPQSSQVRNYTIQNLHPHTRYEVSVAACTEVNCSSHFFTKTFLTAETYPSCAPNLTMWNTSSSSLFVTIDPLGHFCMNGILKFYHFVLLESELYGEIYNLSLNDILKENVENLTVNTHTATGLKKYWNYTAVVYVENSIGNGPHSFKWAVTAQDAPDGPPTNISGYANSSSSIILNVTLPKREHRNGIIRGYKVLLYNLQNFKALEFAYNITDEISNVFSFEGLAKYTDYEVKVKAFTVIGNGPYSSPFNIRTFEDVPSLAAVNFTIVSVTESSVNVMWEDIPDDFLHGVYVSSKLELTGVLANGTTHAESKNVTPNAFIYPHRTQFAGLFPYTSYNISIQGCTRVGCGVKNFSYFETEEMGPIGVVQNLQDQKKNITESLHFNWSDIRPMEKRGRITYFNISLYKFLKPWASISNEAISFLVPANQFNASVYNLDNFTSYKVMVFAMNKRGHGPVAFIELLTPENVPLYSPQITFANNISSSGINVKFTKLPQSSWQGELLGYHVYYQHADEPTNCTAGQICKKMEFKDCIGNDINTCDVTELDLHTNYSVCIAGYTSAGAGPMSECVYVVTDTFVNGNWTEWSEWGNCDRSCANGTEARLRFCINPIPARGGANCSGLDVERRPCNDFPCPGYYLAKPLTDCTQTCNNLGNAFGCSNVIDTINTTHVFETSINGYDYTDVQGVVCSSDDSQKTYSMEHHPSFSVNGNICSGYAHVPRRIKCSIDDTLSEEYRRLCYCIDKESLGYTEWGIWSPCSKTCGSGLSRRLRICRLESGCNKTEDLNDCNTQLCPIDGAWGGWSEYSGCTKSCGIGKIKRTRQCNSPTPLHGGAPCVGTDVQEIIGCNPDPCPQNGSWSDWSSLELCSQPCGVGGTKLQRRYCNNPAPSYGGALCSGPNQNNVSCNEDVVCREVGVNYLVRLTNETWHYTMHYATSEMGRNLHNKLKREVLKFMEKSRIGASVIDRVEVTQLSRGSVIANFTVFYFGNPFIETLILQNAIDDIGFINTIPVQLLAVTSQNVPDVTPTFTAFAEDSSTITISWKDDENWDVSTFGEEFYMYYIFYRDLTIPNLNWTSYGTLNKTVTLPDLNANTLYGIRLVVALIDANGIASSEKKIRTKEGVPFIAPPNFIYQEMSPTSIYLDWGEIPKNEVPGTLLGYKIVYKRLDNNLTRETTTSAIMLQRTLKGLKPATLYLFTIHGYTVAGDGPISFVTLKTAFDAPGVAPPKVAWEDRFSSYQIKISWNPIPAEEENGYVVGYKIKYTLIRQADRDVTVGEKPSVKEVDRFTFSTYIDGLSPYSMYKFEIFAFAKEGDGPVFTFTAETCKCPEILYSNFYSLKPFIHQEKQGLRQVHGFFPRLLKRILRGVCTKCKAYNSPEVYFDRTFSGSPSEKLNARQMKDNIGSTVQLSMPVYGKFTVKKYAGIYPYISIVRTQGSAAIMYDQKVRRYQMKDLLRNVVASWTTVAIMVLMSIICGWLLWFAEQTSSNSDFEIHSAFKGSFQGIWAAFVTMSTVGYGDYTPSTRASKLITICWTLIGLITTSIFIASISTHLVSISLRQEAKLYGVLTAVIPGTAEYSLAVARNAKIYNVSRPIDVLEAVSKGIVPIGLLDAYTATSYSDHLKKMTLTVKKIFDTNSGYGTVLSGGLESLEDDIRSYVDANEGSISAFINSQTKVLKPNVTIIETELIPKDELVEFSILLVYAFLAMCVFGICIWLCCLKRRKLKKIQPLATKEEATREEVLKTELIPRISNFHQSFVAIVKKMDEKHFGELSRLQVLRTNFMRLMTRHGHTKKEVNDRFEAIRKKHLKKIRKRNRLKYLETNI
ncbi:uncharacterized protein LOC130655923 isoform X2 [Hydractinia symbiolongicarpus]|uniref:uncharacterized protein LOC130655923 isoform X2 n=1 Tax=Hydractinia symbiolongicarpus TaxID=13093 RepID=UPI00254B0B9D|nr:uncharacterized protein LOC130655923 isoform X2 [Hydractinia symbiolongicarpus]